MGARIERNDRGSTPKGEYGEPHLKCYMHDLGSCTWQYELTPETIDAYKRHVGTSNFDNAFPSAAESPLAYRLQHARTYVRTWGIDAGMM